MTESRSEEETSTEPTASDDDRSVIIGPAIWSQVEVPDDLIGLAGRTLDDISAPRPPVAPTRDGARQPSTPTPVRRPAPILRPDPTPPPEGPTWIGAPPGPDRGPRTPSGSDLLTTPPMTERWSGSTGFGRRRVRPVAVGLAALVIAAGGGALVWLVDRAGDDAVSVASTDDRLAAPIAGPTPAGGDGPGPETFTQLGSARGRSSTTAVATATEQPTTTRIATSETAAVPSSTTTSSTPSTTPSTTSSSTMTTTTEPMTSTTATGPSSTTATTATSTTTSSGPTSSSTVTTAAPPTIVSFTAGPAGPATVCDDPTHQPVEAAWATEGATSVVVTSPIESHGGPSTGSWILCTPPSSRLTLVATGPGGEAQAAVDL